LLQNYFLVPCSGVSGISESDLLAFTASELLDILT
jgi:hypothetical protein